MFDIGWTEMLVIAIVMIVVVGPKDLPKMLRTFGRTTSKLRAMAGDFRKQFDEALKEAELDDVKGLVDDVRKLNPTNEIRQALNPMQKAASDIRAGLDSALSPPKPAPSTTATPAAPPTPAVETAASAPVTSEKSAEPVAPAPAAKAAKASAGAKKAAASGTASKATAKAPGAKRSAAAAKPASGGKRP